MADLQVVAATWLLRRICHRESQLKGGAVKSGSVPLSMLELGVYGDFMLLALEQEDAIEDAFEEALELVAQRLEIWGFKVRREEPES